MAGAEVAREGLAVQALRRRTDGLQGCHAFVDAFELARVAHREVVARVAELAVDPET
ncbi:hypothetical protein D3C76_1750630 [compost metagenome]